MNGWLLCVALASPLIVETCAHDNSPHPHCSLTVTSLNTQNQCRALSFSCLFKSLSAAGLGRLCAVTPAVTPCVPAYKDSFVTPVCVGSGFAGSEVLLIQKAVCQRVAKGSPDFCVVRFLTVLSKCPVRASCKIYAAFNITRGKKVSFFSAFLSKAIHILFFCFSLIFPGNSVFWYQKWPLFCPFMQILQF